MDYNKCNLNRSYIFYWNICFAHIFKDTNANNKKDIENNNYCEIYTRPNFSCLNTANLIKLAKIKLKVT